MSLKDNGILLKEETNDKDLKIYDMYITRIEYEGNLFWSRFKIFFGFNSAILLIIGYLAQPHLTPDCFDFPKCVLITSSLLSIVGFIFSIIWKKSIEDGKKWVLFFNGKISNIEMIIFKKKQYAIYTGINEKYNKQKIKTDVMDLAIYVSDIFIVIWFGLIILFSHSLLFDIISFIIN